VQPTAADSKKRDVLPTGIPIHEKSFPNELEIGYGTAGWG
jgi:hypothetical protein